VYETPLVRFSNVQFLSVAETSQTEESGTVLILYPVISDPPMSDGGCQVITAVVLP
jgi:hypothetical protein